MDAFIPKNVYKGPLEVPHAEEEIFTSGLIAVNIGVQCYSLIHNVMDFVPGKHSNDFALLAAEDSARVRANQRGKMWRGKMRPEPYWALASKKTPGNVEIHQKDEMGEDILDEETGKQVKGETHYALDYQGFWKPYLDHFRWKRHRMGFKINAPPHWGA
eukprot:CAMPEP_0182912000 /NCGR_PEP_ID=MMETSP0034_2-20130328/37285_1 /TAXON_ID=156128 /ORGANISM="Nephroselmis pyriformis, Strain CCMP717" /LENGTH=158 /DNA_ID=CAMNT_0025048647 /DNA_START=18 /DNA_END=494 /DNA_ORIENTATION=+